MNVDEALSELLIFCREHGGDDCDLHPTVAAAITRIEEHWLGVMNRANARRRRAHHQICLRCESKRSDGILCWACLAEAPARVRNAFQNAAGVDGMRRAHKLVLAWAKPQPNEKERRAA